jgi:hypothetical protein
MEIPKWLSFLSSSLFKTSLDQMPVAEAESGRGPRVLTASAPRCARFKETSSTSLSPGRGHGTGGHGNSSIQKGYASPKEDPLFASLGRKDSIYG